MPNIHVPGTNINWNTNLVPGVNVSDAIHSSSSYQNPTPGSFYPTQTGSSSIPHTAVLSDNFTVPAGAAAKAADTGSGTASSPPPDPYASYGGKAAYDGLVSGYNSTKDATYGSINNAEGSTVGDYGQGILDLVNQLKAGQTGIDRKAQQLELAKIQGTNSVTADVGRGIRSGGVTLSNRNAGTSSATEALARAYGDIGRRELSKVGNQYAQGEASVANDQIDLALQGEQGVQKLHYGKDKAVSTLVDSATTQLSSLDALAARSNLPQRIQIAQEQERIRQDLMSKLNPLDARLGEQVGGVHAADKMANIATAQGLATAGVAPENSFQFNTTGPAEFQNTGPTASNLPLFLSPNTKKQTVG